MHENDRQGQYVHLQHFIHVEWQIQDFPKGMASTPEGSANLLFGIIFAKNCMKMKRKKMTGRGEGRVSLSPPDQALM